MLENFLLNQKDFIKSIKDISYDSNNHIYLCNYEEKFISYDEYIKSIFYQKKLPATPDMLISKDKKIIFVEFKNQFQHRIDTSKLYKKGIEGLLALYEVCDKNKISICDYQKCYIVVYRPKSHRDFVRDRLINRVNKDNNNSKMVLFDLDKLENKFYDNVATVICGKEFVNQLKEYGVKV